MQMQRARLIDPLELIKKKQLAELLSVNPWTIDAWRRSGRLPPALKLSDQIVGWRRRDIERWMQERQEGNDARE